MNNASSFIRLAFFGLFALLLFSILISVFRTKWINEKISVLSEPASTRYVIANSSLPLPKGPRIVLIGDSRIAQWPQSDFPKEWEKLNRGIGGDTSAQLSSRFAADALDLRPDVVLVETGINDLVAASFMGKDAQDVILDKLIDSIQHIAEQSERKRITTLIASIVPPASPSLLRYLVWNDSVLELVLRANARLRQISWPKHVHFVDLTPIVGADRLTAAYSTDALHLNESGYEQLTTFLTGRILSLLKEQPDSTSVGR